MPVYPVNGLEDFFERERRAQEAANARVQPWHGEIKKGDYFVRSSGYGFPIYGQVLRQPKKSGTMKNYIYVLLSPCLRERKSYETPPAFLNMAMLSSHLPACRFQCIVTISQIFATPPDHNWLYASMVCAMLL